MSIASRLVLGSSLVVVVVMTIYGVTSLQQRSRLITDALVRETETLANSMQVVANSAIRSGRVSELDGVLGRILEDPDMAISAVLDSAGTVIAGGPLEALACVEASLERVSVPAELHVWGECGGRVRLVVLPLQQPARSLVLARRTTVVDRDMAASRRRILLTSVALAALASLAILLVLRSTLTRPLSEIMTGVRQLGGPTVPGPVQVPRAGKELRALALAFNEMVDRLEGKRQTLIREAEERVELELRLRRIETFAAMGRLTGGMAHELGTPLGVIGVRAEAIEADADASDAAREHARRISAEVERIARLIRDLVHVARKHGLSPAPVDLRPVVEAVWEMVEDECRRLGIEVDLRLPSQDVTIQADETLLRHAVHNVVLNAIQALAPHRGTRRLLIELHRAGEVARIVVEDTGPGIPPDVYPHLTEPFFTTKDVGEGTGLGLSITSGILEEHGGTLTLVPSGTGGVRVHLDLPVGERAKARGPASAGT